MSYKKSVPLTERIAAAENVMNSHPDHIPIIIERDLNCKDLPDIKNIKFVVSKDITVSHLLYCVRRRIEIKETDAIFLFVGRILPCPNETVGSIYQAHKDADGMLYCTYSSDHAYG